MTIQFAVNQLVKVWGGVDALSRNTNRTKVGLYIDALYSYIRYGCLPRQFTFGGFYNKTRSDRKDILTYRRFYKLMYRVNKAESIHYLENKSDFNRFFAQWIDRDWILSSEVSAGEIDAFIRKYGKVIVKPFNEMEGHGIYKLDADTGIDIVKEAEKLSKGKYMIEEILVQHPMMVFGNTSVNTVRVHTMLDKSGKAHILSCVLRAGVGDTVVDNYNSGGVIYPINVDYGIVSGPGMARDGSVHYLHPQTDIVMLGYRLPNWDKVLSQTKVAAEKLTDIRLVGWDVAITKDGIALIEGNHNPDYELFEFLGHGKSYKQLKQYI